MSVQVQASAAVKGTPWQIRRQGDGEAILILHGADGADSWAPIQAELAAQGQALLPSHPGFDGSPRPAWLDRVSDLANGYLELIETQGWGRVHLIGYGLGGWIAAEMAIRHSGALASLSLITPQGIYVPDVATVDVFLRTDEQLLRDTFHDPALAQAIWDQPRSPEADEVAIRNKEVTARLTWQPRGYDLDLRKWLHRIAAPTQIVWGADDRILPVAYAEAWREAIPDARVVTLEACGHAPHLEQPARLGQALSSFLEQARSVA